MANAAAPSTHSGARQFDRFIRTLPSGSTVEGWLEAERDQLPLWLPVAWGGGVAMWFMLPDAPRWTASIVGLLAFALTGVAAGRGGRLARAIAIGGLAAALGLATMWWRAERVAAPVLAKAGVVKLGGTVEAVETLSARDLIRLTLTTTSTATDNRGRTVILPARVRVNLATADAPKGLVPGAQIHLQARLMPPPAPAVPGAYDFSQTAWFAGIGATGRGSAPVAVVGGAGGGASVRQALTAHITAALPGSAGGIAAALATGDEGAISDQDSEAMRRAGLAHLLSVSGLHITAAVAATMFVVVRVLALWPWLALSVRLPLIAGVAGAGAAIGYTLLTGSQVPTIRSCVAALLILIALAIGREAMTLRLVAAGALVVMLLWPESLAGPSFQLSFAAITAIVAMHEHPRIAALFGSHEEHWLRRQGRSLLSLLTTGLVVEAALMPIAVFHFHKAGLYGAGANIVAIPLTTFVVMPLEALALALDVVGLGAPAWWLCGKALALLIWLAREVASAPGSVASLPAMPTGAFGAMVVGGLWVALWRTRWRWLGAGPLAVGVAWALATPAPDLLVTGDGRHLALRMANGRLAMLRDRAGDYTRNMLAENGGADGEPLLLAEQRDARCSPDLCLAELERAGRHWRVLATRSAYPVPWRDLIAACATADIVVSERVLPDRCRPRWLKLDRRALDRTGGVAVTFTTEHVETVLVPGDAHPWRVSAIRGTSDQRKKPHDRRRDGSLPLPDARAEPFRLSGST